MYCCNHNGGILACSKLPDIIREKGKEYASSVSRSSTGRSCAYAELQPDPPPPVSARSLIQNPSGRPFHKSGDLRYLQFYVEKTVAQLTSFFPDELWSSLVLQLSHSEPSVHNALFALASYHERFLSLGPGPEVESPSALLQYNEAIRSLLDPKKRSSSINVNLVSIVIFFCIETLRGQYTAAIRLFEHGRRLIDEWRREVEPQCQGKHCHSSSHHVIPEVDQVLIRLTIPISQLIDSYHKELFHSEGEEYKFKASAFVVPPRFHSLVEARESIVGLVMDFMSGYRPLGFENDIYFQRILGEWTAALEAFISSRGDAPLSNQDRRTVSLLRLYERYCRIELHFTAMRAQSAAEEKSPSALATIEDDFMDVYSELIELAASALGMEGPEDTWPAQLPAQPQFHLEIGVTWILFAVISQCRDPVLRRRALALIPPESLQEGIWNSAMTSRLGNRLMALEEQGRDGIRVGSDIPAEARIQVRNLMLDSRKKAVVEFEATCNKGKWQELIEL
ncbi:hypothetical protein BX600DRAFT_543722 [Xylariales sp. PMI_506]|nr:hypothetical protein BX600DRAFT_543722 [Xylariales sp. PMI_506]